MVAPINATATIEVGEETYILKADYATFSAAKEAGFNPFKLPDDMDPLDAAPGVAELAKPNHPDFGADKAFALLTLHNEATMTALAELLEKAFPAAMESGDPKPKRPTKKRAA
ncbi:MAG: hypothetical protein AAGB23_05220 [Pseudomonadota bacterium]